MLVRVSPLTPTRCNPIALGFKPENPCQTWDPRAEFRVLYRIETEVLGSAVRALDLSAQLAGSASVLPRMTPPTPSRCNPVALGLKPRESSSNLATMGQILYFNCLAKFEGPSFELPTPTSGDIHSVLVRVSPLTPIRCNPVALGLKPR